MGLNKGHLRHAWQKAALGLIVAAGASTGARAQIAPQTPVVQAPSPDTCAILLPDEGAKQSSKTPPLHADFKTACAPGFQLKVPIYKDPDDAERLPKFHLRMIENKNMLLRDIATRCVPVNDTTKVCIRSRAVKISFRF